MSGGSLEAASKTVPNKTPKRQRWQTILGGYFGAFWAPDLLFVHCVCDDLYAYFWHRFWGASGPNFEDLGVISKTFSQMLRSSKNVTVSSEMLDLGGVGLPFLHNFF